MPHATENSFLDEDDLYAAVTSAQGINLNTIEFGTTEKADDAQDFEDIGDDDLAEDEDEKAAQPVADGDDEDNFGDLFGDNDNDVSVEGDDLFGDNTAPTSPDSSRKSPKQNGIHTQSHKPDFKEVSYGERSQTHAASDNDVEMGDVDPKWLEQQRLLGIAVDGLPMPPQSTDELLQTIWPNFDPKDNPRWTYMFPQKTAHYQNKPPLKVPKAIQPSKLNVELQADQEKGFRLAQPQNSSRKVIHRSEQQQGIQWINNIDGDQEESDEDVEMEDLDANETIGGVAVKDLAVLCEDWELDDFDLTEYDFEHEDTPPAKKPMIFDNGFGQNMPIFQDDFPSFEDPEATAAKFAQRVLLDQNDPRLLIDIVKPDAARKQVRATGADDRQDISGSMAKTLSRRFNMSNDNSYTALKQNHSNKVRSTLGNVAVEHSLPALKLQYPFYKVKLHDREARSAHRSSILFNVNATIRFSKLGSTKRKATKGKSIQELFDTSEKLTLMDNSDLVLFEYSEEYPTVLSNFGMGNRLVNYYRRTSKEDTNRPKKDLGETQVLLPEDQSPFSIFGKVEPGETQPTLQNSMFRAPVFQHEVQPTDFLVARSRTGYYGERWQIRNLSNLFVVGQEFPSVEVPGTHSRKVTEAAKKRLKMISYRLYKKNMHKKPALSNAMLEPHLPGNDIAQIRSKMREFMSYRKEELSWVPKPGEGVPDEQVMRDWIKPEDVCLLDSTQVGHRHLQDAGYTKDGEQLEEDAEDDPDKGSIEQQLAPWNTTKNFLNACQGKAMLQLHGEGDPSARGEAFSFVKTSMKGGFKGIGESVQSKIDDAKKNKANGGHSYNVAQQQAEYNASIDRIWEAQKASLGSKEEPELDYDVAQNSIEEEQDESLAYGRILRIKRNFTDKYGNAKETTEIITDPRVIRMYIKKKEAEATADVDIGKLDANAVGGDEEKLKAIKLAELQRLYRNRERRMIREKQKAGGVGGDTPMSPSNAGSPSATGAAGGKGGGATTRKCANCGQIGHIKTNKKLCPMLNGEMKQVDGFNKAAFGGTAAATPSASQMPPPSAFSPS